MKFFLCLLMLSSFAFADEKMDAKTQAYMDAMMKAGSPGPEHAVLKRMEGKWKATIKVWKEAGSEPMINEGSSDNKIILDGRFLHQDFKGSHMGKPFMGMGDMGYDNLKKQYISTWLDSMSTTIMMMNGTANKDMTSITMVSDFLDPMTKKKMKMKTITRIESDNKHVFEMWHKDMKGKDYMSMEITYTK